MHACLPFLYACQRVSFSYRIRDILSVLFSLWTHSSCWLMQFSAVHCTRIHPEGIFLFCYYHFGIYCYVGMSASSALLYAISKIAFVVRLASVHTHTQWKRDVVLSLSLIVSSSIFLRFTFLVKKETSIGRNVCDSSDKISIRFGLCVSVCFHHG